VEGTQLVLRPIKHNSRHLNRIQAHLILLPSPHRRIQTYGICQQQLNVQRHQLRLRGQRLRRHVELGRQNHPFIILQIHHMVGAAIILAIVMETIPISAVEVSQQEQQQQNVHHRLAHHSYQDSQVS